MKKIPFKDIKTKDELISRIEENRLSVGCWFNNIKKFLSDVPTDENTLPIEVNYSATYGNKTKIMYL